MTIKRGRVPKNCLVQSLKYNHMSLWTDLLGAEIRYVYAGRCRALAQVQSFDNFNAVTRQFFLTGEVPGQRD